MKKVPTGSKGKGLSKLPKAVRNKMGYLKKGGTMKKTKGYKKLYHLNINNLGYLCMCVFFYQ